MVCDSHHIGRLIESAQHQRWPSNRSHIDWHIEGRVVHNAFQNISSDVSLLEIRRLQFQSGGKPNPLLLLDVTGMLSDNISLIG